jgi:hypothetical protein
MFIFKHYLEKGMAPKHQSRESPIENIGQSTREVTEVSHEPMPGVLLTQSSIVADREEASGINGSLERTKEAEGKRVIMIEQSLKNALIDLETKNTDIKDLSNRLGDLQADLLLQQKSYAAQSRELESRRNQERNQVREASEAMVELEELRRSSSAMIKLLEERVHSLLLDNKKLQEQLADLKLDKDTVISKLESGLKLANDNVKESNDSLHQKDERLRKLDQELSDRDSCLESLKNQVQVLENDLQKVRARVDEEVEKGNSSQKENDHKLKALEEQVNFLSEELKRKTNSLLGLEKAKIQLEEDIEDERLNRSRLEKRVLEAEEALGKNSGLEELLQRHQREEADTLEKIKELKEKAKRRKVELVDERKKRDELEDRSKTLKDDWEKQQSFVLAQLEQETELSRKNQQKINDLELLLESQQSEMERQRIEGERLQEEGQNALRIQAVEANKALEESEQVKKGLLEANEQIRRLIQAAQEAEKEQKEQTEVINDLQNQLKKLSMEGHEKEEELRKELNVLSESTGMLKEELRGASEAKLDYQQRLRQITLERESQEKDLKEQLLASEKERSLISASQAELLKNSTEEGKVLGDLKIQLERSSEALRVVTGERDEATKSISKYIEELKRLEQSLILERKDRDNSLVKHSEELRLLKDAINERQTKLSEMEKTSENQRNELERARADQKNVFALKEDESSKLLASFMELRAENNQMIIELERKTNENDRYSKELKARSEECKEMREAVETKEIQSNELKARVEALEAELKARDERIREQGQDLKNRTLELEVAIQRSKSDQEQLKSHEQEESKLRDELKIRLEGNRKLKDVLETERRELEVTKTESKELVTRNSKLADDLSKSCQEVIVLTNKLKELTQNNKDFQQRMQGIEAELSVANQKLADVDKNYQSAKEQISKLNERHSESKKLLDSSLRQSEESEFKLQKDISSLAQKLKESQETQIDLEKEISKQRDQCAEDSRRREKQETERVDRLSQQHSRVVKNLEHTIALRDNEIRQLKLMAVNMHSEPSFQNFTSPDRDSMSKLDNEIVANDWNGSELSSSLIEESPLKKGEITVSMMDFTPDRKRGSLASNSNFELTSLRKARVMVYALEHLIRNLKSKALQKIFASKVIRDRGMGEAGLRVRGRLLLVLRSRYAQVGVRKSLLKWMMLSNPNFLRDCVTKIALISKLTNQTVFWRFRKLVEKKIPKDTFLSQKNSGAARGSFILAKLFAERSRNCIIQTFNIMRPGVVGKKYRLLINILNRKRAGEDATKLKVITYLRRLREMSKRIVERMNRSLIRKSLIAFENLKRNSYSQINSHSEKLFASEVFSTMAILKEKVDNRIRHALKLERLQQLPGKIELIKKQIMSNLRENQKWTLKQLFKHSAKNSSKEFKKNLLLRNLVNSLGSACSSKIQQSFENLIQNKFGLKIEEKMEHARKDKEVSQMLLKKRKGLQRLHLACAAKLRLAYQLLIKNTVSNAGREQILLSDDKRRKAMIGRMMIRLLNGLDTLKLNSFNKLLKHSVELQNTRQLHKLSKQQILAKIIHFQDGKKARCFEILSAFYRQSLNLQQKQHNLVKKIVERSMLKLHSALKRLISNRESTANVKTIEEIKGKNFLTMLANRITKSREVAYLKLILFSSEKLKANQRMQFLLSKLMGSLTQKTKVAMHKLGFVNLKIYAIEKLNETSQEIEADIRLNMTRKAVKRLVIACKGKSLSSLKKLKANKLQIEDETKRREQAVNNIMERLSRAQRDTLGISSLRLKKHAIWLRDKEKRERRGKSLIINRLILALRNAVSSAYTQLQLNSCERESRASESYNNKKLIIQMLRRAQQAKVIGGVYRLRNYCYYVEGCAQRANQLRRKLLSVLARTQNSIAYLALSKLAAQRETALRYEKKKNQFSCLIASFFLRKSKLYLQTGYFAISLHNNKLIGEQDLRKRASWLVTRCIQKGAANKLACSYSKLKSWQLLEKSRGEQADSAKRSLFTRLLSAQRCKLLIAKDRLKEAAVQNLRKMDSKQVRQKESLIRLILASKGRQSQALGTLYKNATSHRANEIKKKIMFSGLEKRASISSLSTIYKLKLNGIVKSFKDELRLNLFSKLLNQVHKRFMTRQIERLVFPHKARELFKKAVKKAEMRVKLAAGSMLEQLRLIVQFSKRLERNRKLTNMLNNFLRNRTIVFRMSLRRWLRNSLEFKSSNEGLLRILARLALRRIGSGFDKIRGMSKLKGLEFRNNGYRLLMTLLEGLVAKRKRESVHRLKLLFHNENRWYKLSVDILTQRTFIDSQIALWRIKDAKDLGLFGVPTNVAVKLRKLANILDRRRARLEQTAFNAINYSALGLSLLTSSALSMKSLIATSAFKP